MNRLSKVSFAAVDVLRGEAYPKIIAVKHTKSEKGPLSRDMYMFLNYVRAHSPSPITLRAPRSVISVLAGVLTYMKTAKKSWLRQALLSKRLHQPVRPLLYHRSLCIAVKHTDSG